MTKILVDSSVWIDYFNGNNPKANILSDLIDNNAICINDLILAELIPSIKNTGEPDLADLLTSVSNIKISIDWQDIIKMQTTNLKNGCTKIGIPDLIILQNVMQNDLLLFSFDSHFKSMQPFHKFKVYEIKSLK
jgi:predicted nucleic acid-binding protein